MAGGGTFGFFASTTPHDRGADAIE